MTPTKGAKQGATGKLPEPGYFKDSGEKNMAKSGNGGGSNANAGWNLPGADDKTLIKSFGK